LNLNIDLISHEEKKMRYNLFLAIWRRGYLMIDTHKSKNEQDLKLAQLSLMCKNPRTRALLFIAFCLFLSIIFLLLGTKSSPLYPFNDWFDANTSFTMGKAFMSGRVLYRDIFDQRGPLFYLIYGISYLISNTSFIGVFLFEVLSFSVFLFFSYKLMRLYLDANYALIALPLLAGGVINMRSFAHGGAPEEFYLPLAVISLFYLIKYFKEVYPDRMPQKWLYVNGIVAGCVLWIKFNSLGFWIGWMGIILIINLINKRFVQLFKDSLIFLSGMLTTTFPWIIYFGVHNAIPDWLNTYIFFNFRAYPKGESGINPLLLIVIDFLRHLSHNSLGVGLMVIGLYVFVKGKKFLGDRLTKIGLLSCVTLLALGVYAGGRTYLYYFLVFAPLFILGLIVLLDMHFEEFGEIKSGKYVINVILISIVGLFSYTLQANQNTYLLDKNKEDLVQFKYASIINQRDDPTLLNYGWLDSGFYTAADIVPNIRFFQRQNIDYSIFPLHDDEQHRYIKEKLVDFVVVPFPVSLYPGYAHIPYLEENYVLIERELETADNVFYYYLYEKRE
jgi:hypothetical protein